MRDFAVAAVLLALPVGLIVRQPDLGTALLIFASGFFVIFLAGLSWKVIGGLAVGGRGEPAVPLVDAARLPAPARADAARPDAGSARRGLPHHPVDHRDRLRRHPRQGVAQRHAGAARLRARALAPTSSSRCSARSSAWWATSCWSCSTCCIIGARPHDRRQRLDRVLAPHRRRHHAHLLHLRVREHGHGERASCRWWACRCR